MTLLTCGPTTEASQPGSAATARARWVQWYALLPTRLHPTFLQSSRHPPTLRLCCHCVCVGGLFLQLPPLPPLPFHALPVRTLSIQMWSDLLHYCCTEGVEGRSRQTKARQGGEKPQDCMSWKQRQEEIPPKRSDQHLEMLSFMKKRAHVGQGAYVAHIPSSSPETWCPKDAS